MQILLSSEAEAKAKKVPDLAARVERFIEEQYALEEWRTRRHSAEVEALTQQVLTEADKLKAQNVSREKLFEQLMAHHDRISTRATHG